MKKAFVITGGEISPEFLSKVLHEKNRTEEDLIIAVDAGLEALDALNIRPDILVGDFDTVDERVLYVYLEGEKVIVDRHDSVKNATDTELAVDAALKEDCDEVYVLGAFGGRMDHTLSNLYLTFRGISHHSVAKKRVRIYLLDELNKIYAIDDLDQQYVIHKKEQWGKYISLFPVKGECRGLSISGVKYPLDRAMINLFKHPSLTTSNEITDDEAVLRIEEGMILVIESKDRRK